MSLRQVRVQLDGAPVFAIRACPVPFAFSRALRPILETYSQRGADDVKVTGSRTAVILPHVIEITRKMLVEPPADSDQKSVANPRVKAPVIEDFISYDPTQLQPIEAKWVFDRNPVPVAGGITLGAAISPFELVAIADREASQVETHR